ncbi:MAG: GNAT family N-acetyltransferase [Pontiellaceae bacterium]|nr:GNAT family N-acetyltransferase [Pontiellaceae bacterium]MBN2784792.1 GNAT family N-acetyltransferase [Pontiellaceae bacterium]
MKIRTATQDDIPAMAELLHQLFAIEVDFTPDHVKQSKGLELLLRQENARVMVAEVDDQVVGMCTIQILVSTAMGCAVGTVEDVVIDVSYRGQGIGSALMRELESWATQKGLARLQLQADRTNAPALCFYRQQGWKHTNLVGWIKTI